MDTVGFFLLGKYIKMFVISTLGFFAIVFDVLETVYHPLLHERYIICLQL
jgi:hypothetical protein